MQKFPKVFTLMSAILALTFGLASCKANADDDPTMYTVTVSSSIEHGKVTADKTSAEAGATIKLTATADSGYELESYSVKDASENELMVTDDTFTMPESNVTVSATFKATTTGGGTTGNGTTGGGTTGNGTTSGGTEKQAGSISYSTASVSKTTDDAAFTNALTKTGDGTVTYASSKETVATVNATTGEVTIVGAGETTITATVADSDTYTYATKTASYTLTVKLPVTLKTGGAINSILLHLCKNEYEHSECTKFARSETNSASATQYLDTEEQYIPVWSVDTEIYYYVPDGFMPVMNEDSSKMFYGFSKLTSLDLTGFDTSDVTNMSEMFYRCGFTSLDVTGIDTSNVTNMKDMFYYCSNLTSLNLTGFDTSKVTNMSQMFYVCSELTTIYATDKFVTTSVTSGDNCFKFCSKLVGGAGTTYDSSQVSSDYARIDGGTDTPGYFTLRN